jgi:hypothetical protein
MPANHSALEKRPWDAADLRSLAKGVGLAFDFIRASLIFWQTQKTGMFQ